MELSVDVNDDNILKQVMETVGEKLQETIIRPKEEMKSLLIRCKGCGGIHFRHAGYIESLIPYADDDGRTRKDVRSTQVKVCVKCKRCYVYLGDDIYDITDDIDIKAWESTEKELQKATGPGGNC